MKTKATTLCAGSCGRQLRPKSEREGAWPGTIRWHAKGMCEACYMTVEWPELERVRPCELCGHPTRPKPMRAADAPGTRVRDGQLCRPCNETGAKVTPERARYVAGEIVAYLKSRGRELDPQLLKKGTQHDH
jgi:hypothetical protein